LAVTWIFICCAEAKSEAEFKKGSYLLLNRP
jgi:hypothetical protein